MAARELSSLVSADRTRLLGITTTSVSAIRLFEQLPRHPIVTVASAMKLLDTTKPTATRGIETLIEAAILAETTGRKRDRSFAYRAYLELLRTNTELPRQLTNNRRRHGHHLCREGRPSHTPRLCVRTNTC